MPSLGFSGANIATVAYAEVDSVAGASTATNSGVTTTRTTTGTYVVILPTGLGQQAARDLIFVQVKQDNSGLAAGNLAAKYAVVDDSLETTKTISVFSDLTIGPGPTRVDGTFCILILRTTIAPPTGSPA